MIAVDLNAVFLRNEGETQPILVLLDSAMALMTKARGYGKGPYNQLQSSLRRKLDFVFGENASFGREKISWYKHHTYRTVLRF